MFHLASTRPGRGPRLTGRNVMMCGPCSPAIGLTMNLWNPTRLPAGPYHLVLWANNLSLRLHVVSKKQHVPTNQSLAPN